MGDQRRAGLIQFQIGGVIQDAKGNFSYDLGLPKRESIVGADGIHGYKETPKPAYIEGAITDRLTLDLAALAATDDVTVTLTLGNGKVISLPSAYYTGDGKASSEEAEIEVRFESKAQGQEITP